MPGVQIGNAIVNAPLGTQPIVPGVDPNFIPLSTQHDLATLQARSVIGAGAPAGTGTNGYEYWDTTNKRLYRSDGTGWIIIAEPVLGFTSTVSAFAGTITTASCTLAYRRSDGWLDAEGTVSVTTNGTGTGYVGLTLPTAVKTGNLYIGNGRNQVTAKQLQVASFGNVATCYIENYDGTYPVADGQTLDIAIRYQMTTRYS